MSGSRHMFHMVCTVHVWARIKSNTNRLLNKRKKKKDITLELESQYCRFSTTVVAELTNRVDPDSLDSI
jgi:hypothetical protein